MRRFVQCSVQRMARGSSPLTCLIVFMFSSAIVTASIGLHAQCPNTGETKVTTRREGTGYYFFKFLGDSSFFYFLDGKTFSFNDKDDPGKTFVFIDNFAYESTFVDREYLSTLVKSSKPLDILRAQAKHQQAYFKSAVPSIVITDYGPSARKNPDGSDDRLFYLWKKDSAPGTPAAPQYLVSTLVKDGVVVLSVMPGNGPVSEEDLFLQVEKYTSHFGLLSDIQCAEVLSAPAAP